MFWLSLLIFRKFHHYYCIHLNKSLILFNMVKKQTKTSDYLIEDSIEK